MKTRHGKSVTEAVLREARERAWESFMSAAWAHSKATGERVRAAGIPRPGGRWVYVFACASCCPECAVAIVEATK